MAAQFTTTGYLLAWLVHLFTASGIVAGFLALTAVAAHDWRMAMFWLLVSQIIDGIDGTFARLCRVKEVLPHFDGKMLDSVIDFATYAIIPAYFMYEADMVAPQFRFTMAALVLLTSAIYYGKSGMVSHDYHFVGFPVMWNLVAFYFFFVFNLGYTLNLIFILAFCVLHFIPFKYLYPSRTTAFKYLTIAVTVAGLVCSALLVYLYPQELPVVGWLKGVSVAMLLYFAGMTVYKSFFYTTNSGFRNFLPPKRV
ncbi:MAG TPA: CDP-alcohol phosphatidyltransferase family protein [Chitinophagales bacterium]|nr:CDP-alcohol phosphatidyltransferase family protein [Chitinophagales bacterium]HRK27229.1 CDP-alcohol phosphatidyltransferase family protein [Chitinophagales bacterium]